MGYLNKVMLIGRLGQEPEKKVTPSGDSVMNVSLATSEFYKDKQGNKQEKTEWHRIVLWGNLADLVERYCKKGSQIYAEGSLHTKEWQDKDGNKRYTTEVNGRVIQFLDPKNGEPNEAQHGDPPPQSSGQQDGNKLVEDDIPF